MIHICVIISIAGVASALISEDEPEDVRPSDDAILATATARQTSVANHNTAGAAAAASVDKRRRQSAPSDAAALLDNRRRHPVLPRTLLTHTPLCLVLNKNFASINTTTV